MVKFPRNWRIISIEKAEGYLDTLERLKVPGGWLVKSSIVFNKQPHIEIHKIDDPEHTWVLEAESQNV